MLNIANLIIFKLLYIIFMCGGMLKIWVGLRFQGCLSDRLTRHTTVLNRTENDGTVLFPMVCMVNLP